MNLALDRPLIAVYLITFRNWPVVWVGYVSLVTNGVMLVLQTPVGDFIDKTRHKRPITALAILVASVTTTAVAWTSELWAIIAIKAIEGAAATIFLPALMSLLLAVVPDRKVGATVALTETSNKIGSVLFTIVAGLASYFTYPDVSSVFYVLGGGGVVASVFVLLIPPATVDDDRARQLDTKKEAKGEASPNDAAMKVSASNYRELFRNRNIVLFAVLTFLYHLSNAGIVPLVSQLIAQQDERASLAFTSAVLCIFYFVQAPTAYIVGLTYHRFGYKNILLVGHLVLPIRCTVLALCARFVPNRYALVSTQVFDGIGAGIYDTLMPLVVKQLVQGTGRYGFTFGFIVTCWRLGHGLSYLLAETILHQSSYEVAFATLGGLGLCVCVLLLFGVHVPPERSDAPDEHAAAAKPADDQAEP